MKRLLKLTVGTLFCSTLLLAAPKDIHKGVVIETIDTPMYTYVQLQDDNKQTFWAAVMKSEFKKGQKVELTEQVWMQNFKSKSIDRTFDRILFADVKGAKVKNIHNIHGQHKKKPNPEFNKDVVITKGEAKPVANIEELFKNKNNYKNKNVSLNAKVIQVSNKVMGNTWVKLSDATGAVIFRSSNEDEKLKIGDKVQATGTVNTDVNYGFGFKYEVIGVGATFKKN